MHLSSTSIVAATAGLTAAVFAFFSSSAGAQSQPSEIKTVSDLETAIFAGGCFWCVEADFDKLGDGIIATVSGYTGGEGDNPTYSTHKRLGHVEAVEVTYDPTEVSYETLVEYFFRHIDPTDAGGQFCDRGKTYATAIFTANEHEAEIVRSEIEAIEASGLLDKPVVTELREEMTFHRAEDAHQDYYRKQPVRYGFYREACGRDKRLEAVWGSDPSW